MTGSFFSESWSMAKTSASLAYLIKRSKTASGACGFCLAAVIISSSADRESNPNRATLLARVAMSPAKK